jgi:DNA modification methylase
MLCPVMPYSILCGDTRAILQTLSPQSVQCVVTSPPYWGLRDYGTATWEGGDLTCDHRAGRFQRGGLGPKQASNVGSAGDKATHECPRCGAHRVDGQIGLERTPQEYVAGLVDLFREIRRVLCDDGVVWLNLGDCYQSGTRGGYSRSRNGVNKNKGSSASDFTAAPNRLPQDGLKDKDLVGIPWRVALALQDDGWYLRSDIIWSKPNPMPESITDRPTKSHEYIFLLAKSRKYFYDANAIKEPSVDAAGKTRGGSLSKFGRDEQRISGQAHRGDDEYRSSGLRNKRTVWTITPRPFKGAHFATFPEALVDPCIRAGSRKGDLILDPFCGSGTVGVVSLRLGRSFLGIDLNPLYVGLAIDRLSGLEGPATPGGKEAP